MTSREALDLYESLPMGIYTVDVDPRDGSFYLKTVDDFAGVKDQRVYGDSAQ